MQLGLEMEPMRLEQSRVGDVGGSLVQRTDSFQRSVNLDANANAAPTEAVIRAVERALRNGANPSSAHGGGDTSRVEIERTRDAVAALVEGAWPENIVFTSGCTEANNQVVRSAEQHGATVILSSVEHPSVARAAEAARQAGRQVEILPVDPAGRVRLDVLEQRLERLAGPILLSIQAANSETGVLQPLEAISTIARRRTDVWLHADAAQAFGKMKLTLGPDGVDVLTVSGHKVHAPMGVGALLTAEGDERVRPSQFGGDQEGGLRAGTQPVSLIAGFGEACAERLSSWDRDVGHMATLRDRLEQALLNALPGSWINGAAAPRLPNTTNIGVRGLESTALVGVLDAGGIFASQGSACHSRRPEPSPVLRAMGLSEEAAYSSVRFSVSPLNTLEEIDAAVPVIVEACRLLGIRA